jgi:hypothetical protein
MAYREGLDAVYRTLLVACSTSLASRSRRLAPDSVRCRRRSASAVVDVVVLLRASAIASAQRLHACIYIRHARYYILADTYSAGSLKSL